MAEDWKVKVGAIFGDIDLLFALNPKDNQRAFELMGMLRDEGVGWAELEMAARAFLSSKTTNTSHIEQQIEKMKSAMSFWIVD